MQLLLLIFLQLKVYLKNFQRLFHMKRFVYLLLVLVSTTAYSQTINDLISQVSIDTLSLKVREFSGEIPTVVNGTEVTILNRESSNNDVAAEYIKEQFAQFNNLSVTDQVYSANGRNIFATQFGKTNPENIYIICGHYDSVANYCADDNASGTVAVLEVARILSQQCLNNTIVYALWDQEENGLIGSNFYAQLAAANGDNILGVLNLDMMAYDGDGDNDFDIDVRDFANSLAMKDDILAVLNTPEYGFTLNANVVNPGTLASDHSRFWAQGFSAVLLGEAWSNNDQTPFYHSSNDRFSTLNLPYYEQLTKLVLAYMATKAELVNVNNSLTVSTSTITSNQPSGSYQWINCTTGLPISGEMNQSFTPSEIGDYAVAITIGNCTEISECYSFTTLANQEFTQNDVQIYPNPVKTELHVDMISETEEIQLNLFDITGKLVLTKALQDPVNTINLKSISKGIYFLNLKSSTKTGTFKIIKE